MDAAKTAVKNILHKDGKHDTTVHEKVAPAVQNETVTRTQEDHIQTAIEKETHQDHYHTTVQPVKDTEVLPEKHHHKVAPVEERTFEHDDASRVKANLDAEAAKFRSTSERVDGKHETIAEPVVAGEHVHHHVHETIQPVVQKQTIEPHVVHETVPIHEVHHNAAQHHSTTALPAMNMAEFKASGGALTGREERHDAFDGCPKPGQASTHGTANSIEIHDHGHGHTHTHGNSNGNSNGVGLTGTGAGVGAGLAGSRAPGHSAGSGAALNGSSTLGSKNEKPGLMEKLNPKTDADHDGKIGIMD